MTETRPDQHSRAVPTCALSGHIPGERVVNDTNHQIEISKTILTVSLLFAA